MICLVNPMYSSDPRNRGGLTTFHVVLSGIALFCSISTFAAPTTEPSTRPDQAPAPQVDRVDQMRQWFADLANSDASMRDGAMVNLMGMRRDDLPMLRKIVEENLPLVPSQAAVLRRIVIQVYLAGDTYESNAQLGFLGIRMAPTSVSLRDFNPDASLSRPISGVVVESRMPGFCAGRMLHDGDVIIGIAEQPQVSLQTTTDFAIAIQNVAPGETVHFQVLRQGQIHRVPITLDPRPAAADQGLVEMQELLERRHRESEAYWAHEFAKVMKEGVS